MILMLVEFVVWWYSTGWIEVCGKVGGRVRAVWRMFSVPILLRTLFAPWRRIISAPGKGIDQLFRSMIDNTVSRAVGFTVRMFALFSALLLTVLASIAGVVMLLAWPFLPLAVFFFLLKGLGL